MLTGDDVTVEINNSQMPRFQKLYRDIRSRLLMPWAVFQLPHPGSFLWLNSRVSNIRSAIEERIRKENGPS